jgi:hypothetical protein
MLYSKARRIIVETKQNNKFKIGDYVIDHYSAFNEEEVKIWGVTYSEHDKEYVYGTTNGKGEFDIAYETSLSALKKKDELEKGDKFKNNGNKMEVLAVGKDDYYHHVEYYARKISGTEKGMTSLIPAHNIDEIIYE